MNQFTVRATGRWRHAPSSRGAAAVALRWWGIASLGLLATTAFSSEASAQIVNVLSAVEAEDSEGLSGAYQGSIDWRSGNTNLFDVTLGAAVRYRRGDHLLFLAGRFEYAEKADAAYIDVDEEHIRYRYTLKFPFQIEGFVQHSRDVFRNRALRAVVGIGPRVVLFHQPERLRAAFGLAYMPEYEHQRNHDDPTQEQSFFIHRASTYLTVAAKVHKKIDVGLTTFVQPALTDLSNVNMWTELAANFRYWEFLWLGLSYQVIVDTTPAYNAHSTNSLRKLTLNGSF